jgi:hypothetical protein
MRDIDLISMVNPGFELRFCTRWISRGEVIISLLWYYLERVHIRVTINEEFRLPRYVCFYIGMQAHMLFLLIILAKAKVTELLDFFYFLYRGPLDFTFSTHLLVKIGTHRLSTCRYNSLCYRYCIMDLF